MNGYNNLDTILKTYAQSRVKKDIDLARSVDTSKTVVSKKTLRKVRSLIKNYDRTSAWNELPIVLRRIVAAVLIVCTISFAMCLSVEAIRNEIVNTIVDWYDKFVALFHIADTPSDKIEEYKEPTLQLEGVEKIIFVKDSTIYSIKYTSSGDPVIKYQQDIIGNATFKIDSECDCSRNNTIVNDCPAILFTYNDGTNLLVWSDSKYAYSIFSCTRAIDVDTLIFMAESVE